MRQATIATAGRPPERPHCSRGEGQDQRESEQSKHRFHPKIQVGYLIITPLLLGQMHRRGRRGAPIPAINRHMVTVSSNASGTSTFPSHRAGRRRGKAHPRRAGNRPTGPYPRRSGVPGSGARSAKVSARLKAAPWPRPSSTTHRVLAVEPATRRPKRLHQTCQRPPNDASLRGPPRGDHGNQEHCHDRHGLREPEHPPCSGCTHPLRLQDLREPRQRHVVGE